MKGLRIATVALCAVLLCILAPVRSEAAINPMISFQGKLTNPDGTNVTDGNYSLRFRIYTDPTADTGACANTCKWEETQGTVSVSGGLFHVNLGSVTALPGSVDFNASALYLGIKVSTDAEMTPRVRLTATPYAFNSDTIDGLDSTSLVQLSPGSQQTGNINVSGTITSGAINGITIGSTISGTGTLTVASGGSGNLVLDSASNTIQLAATDTMIQRTAGGTTTINLVDGANTLLSITNSGAGTASINVDGGYQIGGAAGASTTCSGGQIVQNLVINGGIATGGTCGTSYGTVQDEGSALTLRQTVNFAGGGIACADNAGSSRTDCSVAFISSDGAGVTSSASGLESGTGGFGLVQGCSNGQVLKWNDTSAVWECGTDRGSFHNVLDGNYTNNTTTFTDVDNNSDATDKLGFTIGANETWVFFADAQLQSNTTADQQWRVNAPSGATCDISVANVEQTISVSNLGCGTTTGNIAADAVTNNIFISGSIRNGATGGTVVVQYRQAAASTASTVHAGSYINAYRVDGADLAEIYYTKETDVFPGSLVVLNPSTEAGVNKSRAPYEQNMLGIVSTEPGHVLGQKKPPPGGTPVMVALSGRVPVRVSAENGPIRPGDYLTSSSTPGVAMRATQPGFAVAQALTGYDGDGQGAVVGFIKHVWYSPPQALGTELQNGTVAGTTLGALSINGSLTVIGDTTFRGKIFAGDIVIDGHLTVGSDTAGTAVIPAGQTSVRVHFRRPYASTPKITTGVSGYTLVKIDERTPQGFTLSIPLAAQDDISIDWLAVEGR